jgi:hypothetical protein
MYLLIFWILIFWVITSCSLVVTNILEEPAASIIRVHYHEIFMVSEDHNQNLHENLKYHLFITYYTVKTVDSIIVMQIILY